MDISTAISTWTGIIQYFSPVFTRPTAAIFMSLVTGWVLCTAKRTITGILPFADPEHNRPHDAYHRFFSQASWAISELWKLLAVLVVSIFYPTGVIPTDVDDTLFHHSGRKVDGAGWWRDAVRSTAGCTVHAWGLNLVVLTLRIHAPWGGEPLGLPIDMRLHRKDGPTLIDLAQEMLVEIGQWLPERQFHCHCDGFYASLAGRDIPNTHLTSRMRRDADIYDLPPKSRARQRGRPRKKGSKLAAPQQMAERVRNWRPVETLERGKIKKRLVYVSRIHSRTQSSFSAGRSRRPGRAKVRSGLRVWVCGFIRWCGFGICSGTTPTDALWFFPGIPAKLVRAFRMPWAACGESFGGEELN